MNYFLKQIIALCFSFVAFFVAYGKNKTGNDHNRVHSIDREPNPKQQFLRLLSLGEYYKTRNLLKAESLRHVLLTKSRQLDDSVRLSALLFSAEINQLIGNKEEYFKNVLACQSFLEKTISDLVSYKIYHHLGLVYSISQKFDSAKIYLQIASEIALKRGNNADLAENYNAIALYHVFKDDKDSALYYSDVALKYGRRSYRKTMMDECLNMKSFIFQHFGQLELSVAKNLLAADLAEKTNDRYHLAQYYREIGVAQRLIRNLSAAEFYLKRSLNYSSQIADQRQMALALIVMGYIRYDDQDYNAAVQRINKSLRYLKAVNDPNSLGEAHNLLGMVSREKKHYKNATLSLNNALMHFKSAGNPEKIAEVYHNISTVFIYQRKFEEALSCLFRSVDIRKKTGEQNQICESYRVLSHIYRELEQPAKALVYLEKYVNHKDSQKIVTTSKNIADLSENYRSELRFRLIQSQANSIEEQRRKKALTETTLENTQLRNKLQLYIIIAMIILVLSAGIIVFYLTKQTKLKQQQREAEMSQTLLRAQMNPHFVFNALSVIQSYIHENDTVNSSKFLVNFSKLMRLILENSSKEFISLETEIEILQKYLEIQKIRFADRFKFSIDIGKDVSVERAMIPPMITQPFVENAIEHGQLHTNKDGVITICFRRSKKLLEVTIEDNGIGRSHSALSEKSKTHKSMGIAITRERIQNLNKKYGTDGFLHIKDLKEGGKRGTKVLIWLPYKENYLPPLEK
jgi:hypothetical protein